MSSQSVNSQQANSQQMSSQQTPEPSFGQKIASLFSALSQWAKMGFPVVDEETYLQRRRICESCEHWDADGYARLGKCRICGCTAAKLALATSACPVQKWPAVQLSRPVKESTES